MYLAFYIFYIFLYLFNIFYVFLYFAKDIRTFYAKMLIFLRTFKKKHKKNIKSVIHSSKVMNWHAQEAAEGQNPMFLDPLLAVPGWLAS